MAARYTDTEILGLLSEKKLLPDGYRQRLRLRDRNGQRECECRVVGANGNEFWLKIRQTKFNPLDFSVILAVRLPNSNQLFRLRRYNGRHGLHVNRIEGDRLSGCHVHTATQRYQELGAREDAYAEPSEDFATLDEALNCLLRDCGFDVPPDAQLPLFKER